MMKQLDESLLITAGITVVYQLFFYAIAATLKFDKVRSYYENYENQKNSETFHRSQILPEGAIL